MLTLPALTPVTIPVPDPTVALSVELLDHFPFAVASESVIVVPTHTTVVEAVIGSGAVLIVTVLVVALVNVPELLHSPVPSQVITQ